jgi:hypothetical protein
MTVQQEFNYHQNINSVYSRTYISYQRNHNNNHYVHSKSDPKEVYKRLIKENADDHKLSESIQKCIEYIHSATDADIVNVDDNCSDYSVSDHEYEHFDLLNYNFEDEFDNNIYNNARESPLLNYVNLHCKLHNVDSKKTNNIFKSNTENLLNGNLSLLKSNRLKSNLLKIKKSFSLTRRLKSNSRQVKFKSAISSKGNQMNHSWLLPPKSYSL